VTYGHKYSKSKKRGNQAIWENEFLPSKRRQITSKSGGDIVDYFIDGRE